MAAEIIGLIGVGTILGTAGVGTVIITGLGIRAVARSTIPSLKFNRNKERAFTSFVTQVNATKVQPRFCVTEDTVEKLTTSGWKRDTHHVWNEKMNLQIPIQSSPLYNDYTPVEPDDIIFTSYEKS